MPSTSKVTCSLRISATVRGMLISAPVRLRSFGIDCRFGGLNHWRELLAVLHCRPEPSLGLCRCSDPAEIHLVGLRRSLVRCFQCCLTLRSRTFIAPGSLHHGHAPACIDRNHLHHLAVATAKATIVPRPAQSIAGDDRAVFLPVHLHVGSSSRLPGDRAFPASATTPRAMSTAFTVKYSPASIPSFA